MDESHEYIFGANTLENLTTGMYKDSKVIYREYIQNACDQIDELIYNEHRDSKKAEINIWISSEDRKVTIEDNATGIKESKFKRVMGNIADSDKRIGRCKGFRGIGRLCGLAYCKKLVFRTSAEGEDVESILECDAELMRKMINENNVGNRHTAEEILKSINKFSKCKTDLNSHYFKVELIEINKENEDLLDKSAIRDYLSFIAPVPYASSFDHRKKIYDHAKNINFKIDEYKIYLEGEQIFKKYCPDLYDKNYEIYDVIYDVHFKDIYDEEKNLICWMWIGLSKFSKVIPNSKANPLNPMRGLRLRKENIQIGDEDTLKNFFKEERGNNYFVGEVFAASSGLIPNSQRDYFNETPMRFKFESGLRDFFESELNDTYRTASDLNSANRSKDAASIKLCEHKAKLKKGDFINEDQKKEEYDTIIAELANADAKKEKVMKKLEKLGEDVLPKKVLDHISSEYKPTTKKVDNIPKNNSYRTDKEIYTKYTRREKELITKIYTIILEKIEGDKANQIIKIIEDGLK